MPMTVDQLAWLRSQVGTATPPTDEDLDVYFDRLLTVEAVAEEILETRLADLLAGPASFSISGKYSENNAANIKALQDRLASLRVEFPAIGGSTVTIKYPVRSLR